VRLAAAAASLARRHPPRPRFPIPEAPRGPPPESPAALRARCDATQARLVAALEAWGRGHGFPLPGRWPRKLLGWGRLDLAHQIAPAKGVAAFHRHLLQREDGGAPGAWTSFAFLGPRLVEAGLLPELPRDPGYGPGGVGHYVLLGTGEVLCLRHGYADLARSRLRRFGDRGSSVRWQLEQLGIRDPELLGRAER